jgi:aspartyl-tRNA(Asn)/glutamyl-tRNA(Gln) amidotransferase subunit A
LAIGSTSAEAEGAAAPKLVKDPGRIADLASRLASGDLTPSGLLETFFARIDSVEREVAGWREIDRSAARAAAAAATRAGPNGALFGIPIAIKDVIDVAGLPTRAGSRVRERATPATADAGVVADLRAAGAIIAGKAHTTEFAHFWGPPPTRNPHDLRCTPGGSSAGPAAIVAAGMAPAALGTQTAGSVSRPAAYCGIGAFKPSALSLSAVGMVPMAPAFDTIGFFGYRIEDAVALFRAAAPAFLPQESLPAINRVLRMGDPILELADAAVGASMDEAAGRLGEVCDVAEARSPVSFAALQDAHRTIVDYEAARVHSAALADSLDLLSEGFREALAKGTAVTNGDYFAARRDLSRLSRTLWEHVPAGTAILFPAAPAPAPEGTATGDPAFIVPFTASGAPIASLPVGFAPSGLPLGVLLATRPGHDHALAAFAESVAAALETPR